MTFHPLKHAVTLPPAQLGRGTLANRGGLIGLHPELREAGKVQLAAALSSNPTPCLFGSTHLHLIPYFFSILKTKLPIEKSRVFTCRFHIANPSQPANPSVPGSPGLCGKSPGLGPMPRTQLCSQPRAWRSHLPKGPSLGFLPGTYSCLYFIFWGDNHPDDAWQSELCLF